MTSCSGSSQSTERRPDHLLVSVVQRLCHDTKIKLEAGKEEKIIPCSVGDKPGDNVAPALFLALVQALAEALEKEWSENEVDAPQFRQIEKMEPADSWGKP